MPKSLRLFIASPLDSAATAPMLALIQPLRMHLEQLPQPPNLRWIQSEQWHLTWHFLGQTPEESVPELQAGLSEVLAGKAALTARWEKLCWWPSRHRPQILVAQLQSTPEIQAVYEAMLPILPQANTKHPESTAKAPSRKPFNPHITLARFKGRGAAHRIPLPSLPELSTEKPPWVMDTVSLFSSELKASGAIHTPLHTVKLLVSPTV